MKSIADFVEGKIRRTESEAAMRFERGGDPHAELGAAEGVLTGPAGAVVLYERGLVLADGSVVAYGAIARAVRADASTIEVGLDDGRGVRIAGSPVGCEILYGTLRWIGNALLHRRIAE